MNRINLIGQSVTGKRKFFCSMTDEDHTYWVRMEGSTKDTVIEPVHETKQWAQAEECKFLMELIYD